jgi:Spy/CpxP family protein refolding chaperone
LFTFKNEKTDMKKMITSALILALTIGAAQAQTTPGKHQGHKKEQKMAYDKLNLSAEQKTSVKKINEDFKKKMEDLKKQDQLTVAEMKQRRQALQEQHQSQIQAILTPAQKDQVAKMKANRNTMNKEGKARFDRKGQAFGKRGATMQKELNLTEDQQEKVAKIRSSYRTKMQDLRGDNALSQDQKKTKMQELMKQQQEEMKSVLTKEQIEKMKSLRQEHRAKNTK